MVETHWLSIAVGSGQNLVQFFIIQIISKFRFTLVMIGKMNFDLEYPFSIIWKVIWDDAKYTFVLIILAGFQS